MNSILLQLIWCGRKIAKFVQSARHFIIEIRLRISTSDKKNNRFFDCLFIAYFCLAWSTPFFYVLPINHNLFVPFSASFKLSTSDAMKCFLYFKGDVP